MDIIVIEIIPKDNILKDYFLLPLIDYTNNYNKLISKDIAIIQYPHGNLNYSYGKIIRVTKMAEFAHDAGTDEGSSGSPIFLKGTIRVIGIHKSGIKNNFINENFGEFIWPIFSYFINLSENKIERNNNTFSYYEQNNLIKNLNRINTVNSINNSNIDKLNQMTIIYDIDINKNSIKLFGTEFVKNNINNCFIL